MNAENGWLTNIEGHSNKTYLYTLMPKATMSGQSQGFVKKIYPKDFQDNPLIWIFQGSRFQNGKGVDGTDNFLQTEAKNLGYIGY